MELQLINQEISEARLYRSTSQFNKFDGRDIANLVYLITLSTYFVANETPTEKLGTQYAKRTLQNGTYAVFRTSATDLYLLCYTILHPANDHVNIKNAAASKKFLNGLRFNGRDHLKFMRNIATGHGDQSMVTQYLMRLERQLRIQDPRYKSWRRTVSDVHSATPKQKKAVRNNMYKEYRRIGGGAGNRAEMAGILSSTITNRDIQRLRRDAERQDKPSTTRRVAGTVAGAAAGRYVAGKVKDTPRSKNIGTGLGAIAGYWASGRRKS